MNTTAVDVNALVDELGQTDQPPLFVGNISAANGSQAGSLAIDDQPSPSREGNFSDDYQLQDVVTGDLITINLTGNFDTYLELIDDATQQVLLEDDDGGAGFNSQLVFTAEAGVDYRVRATSFSPGVTGDYDLTVTKSAPDLLVSDIQLPSTGARGESIEISWVVTNQGAQLSDLEWIESLILSQNEVLGDQDDIVLDFATFSDSMASGSSVTRTQSMTLPARLPDGQYHLILQVDPAEQVTEVDDNNNHMVSAQPLEISSPDIDLSISEFTAPTAGIRGQSVDVSWTIQNQGTLEIVGSRNDRLSLSSNAIAGDADDIQITSFFNDEAIAAGESWSQIEQIILPDFIEDGDYYFVLETDRFNDLAESSEQNNVWVSDQLISLSSPDLVVVDVTAPTTGASGQTVEISWTLTNQGTADATGSWTDAIYFAENDQVDGLANRLLEEVTFEGTITAGESVTRTQNVTLPEDLNGQGFIRVDTDNDLDLVESNNANNTGFANAEFTGWSATIFVDNDNIIAGNAFNAGTAYTGQLLSNTDSTFNTGESPNDIILGTDGDDNIWSGIEGDDIIIGADGNDNISFGGGDVQVQAGDGDDFVYASGISSGTNTINLGAGSDTFWASTGNNSITGVDNNLLHLGVGNDTVNTGAGDDSVYSLNGGGGINTLNLGAGDNIVYVENGDYRITSEAGDDTFGLGSGTDQVNAGDGNNMIYQVTSNLNDGAKTISTGIGNDWVQTGSGDDILDLGVNDGNESSYDMAYGQGGSDTFVLNLGSGYLTIGDFTQGEDQLALIDLNFSGDMGVTTDLNQNSTWIWSQSGDVLAELKNFTSDLTESDFISI